MCCSLITMKYRDGITRNNVFLGVHSSTGVVLGFGLVWFSEGGWVRMSLL